MEEEFKTVAQYADSVSAEIAAGMLRANGIPAGVFGGTSPYPSLNATINYVQVKVNAADYDAALSLLAASDKAE